jgi:predicted metal-dependent hydrolase
VFSSIFKGRIVIYRRRRYVRRRRVRSRRQINRGDYLLKKESARQLVVSRLEFFTGEYARLDPVAAEAMKYKRVFIRNQRGRWGSCSSRKNLSFNYRLLELDPELRDYVVVHELCHLKEFNHGKDFWNLMKLTVPRAEEFHLMARKIRIT